jgi:acetyl-CoA acetyltransferase
VPCGALLFPPVPCCPYCGSADIDIVEVSGRGTVAGVTVNHHPWLPGFPPPYAVAIVALEEDDRVRLTTNITGCPPEDVHPGLRVQVDFEQSDDIWLPVFSPVPGVGAGPLPEEDPAAFAPRPMVSASKFEDRVVISGIGMSDIGRRLMRDPLSLTVDACRKAIADAGLEPADIDGLSTYPGILAAGGHGEGGVTAVENVLRLHPTWVSGGKETHGQSGSIVNAMLAVAAGLCRHVLCFRTSWESTYIELRRQGRLAEPEGRISDERQWRLPYGAASPAIWIAMNASLHMHRYGTTRETLGWIALNARKNAALNPSAVYTAPLTMDGYLSARMITTPFGLYDCDVPCDAATAVIVSAADTVPDLASVPVRVEAVGTQITEVISWDQGTLEHFPLVTGPAAHLWSRTVLRPADVDVALLYDGFSFNCLSWIEALGFCGTGEAKDFLDGGTRIALDGELPLNPHGGQLSAGRTHGYGFVHEAVTQLRGAAGARQVADARVAVVSTGGGVPGGCILFRRD